MSDPCAFLWDSNDDPAYNSVLELIFSHVLRSRRPLPARVVLVVVYVVDARNLAQPHARHSPFQKVISPLVLPSGL